MDREALSQRRTELIKAIGETKTILDQLQGALAETNMWAAKMEKALAAEKEESDAA